MSNDPAINLAIGCVVTGILVLKEYLVQGNSLFPCKYSFNTSIIFIYPKVHKYWTLEAIETISYLNMTFFSLVSLYLLESGRDRIITAYISGSITFVLFKVIFTYHVFIEITRSSGLIVDNL